MAGIPMGAPAPTSTPPARDPRASRTRTRVGHCAIGVGGGTLQVFSSRERGAPRGVTVTVGTDALQLTGAMTPTQARSMAKALASAADAVERQQGGAA